MSIKKSVLALAMAVAAVMAFAAPAMATDGKLRDTGAGTAEAGAGVILHTIGFAKFTTGGGTFECHVTSTVETETASTGKVTVFTVPDTTKCTGTGLLNGCKLKSHVTDNLPYHATITNNGRVDITGNIKLTIGYKECGAVSTELTFTEIQLTPLKTGERVITGGETTIVGGKEVGHLGITAALGEPIAGFEIDGTTGGSATTKDIFGIHHTEAATASGEFELTPDTRCTYEITAT